MVEEIAERKEKILWKGKPDLLLPLLTYGIPAVIIAVIGIFATLAVEGYKDPLFFWFLIGFMIIAPIITLVNELSTTYIITDKRVIYENLFPNHMKSNWEIPISEIKTIKISNRSFGKITGREIGDLIITKTSSYLMASMFYNSIVFSFIENPRQAYTILKRAKEVNGII